MTKIKQAGNAHSLSKMFQIFAAVHKSMFKIWQHSSSFENLALILVLTTIFIGNLQFWRDAVRGTGFLFRILPLKRLCILL